MMTVVLSLYSCIHDEVYSSADQSSTEYINKSLWEQDEKYIKNVMAVYAENEDEIKKVSGTPYWNYATTVESFDESFVAVPIVSGRKVVSVMKVPRHGSKIYFYYTADKNDLEFFQGLVFANYKKIIPPEFSDMQTEGMACKRQWFSVWLPDDESNPDPASGPGQWHSTSVIVCKQFVDECTGVVNEFGICDQGGAGDGGGWDYPGAGGGDTEPEEEDDDPCKRAKATTTDVKFTSSAQILKGKTDLKRETGYTLSHGVQPQFLDSPLGSTEVNFTFHSTTYAFMHTHFDGIYPIFSPGDIVRFNEWIVWAKNWNDIPTNNPKIDLNNLSYTVVTSWGSYTMTYDGIGATPFQNFTQQEVDNINDRYISLLKSCATAGASGISYNMEKVEKEFMKFMRDNLSMPDLKLFKVENSGNTELYLENGNRKTNPCPN